MFKSFGGLPKCYWGWWYCLKWLCTRTATYFHDHNRVREIKKRNSALGFKIIRFVRYHKTFYFYRIKPTLEMKPCSWAILSYCRGFRLPWNVIKRSLFRYDNAEGITKTRGGGGGKPITFYKYCSTCEHKLISAKTAIDRWRTVADRIACCESVAVFSDDCFASRDPIALAPRGSVARKTKSRWRTRLVFADETHRSERSAFQRRQTAGARTRGVFAGRQTAATRGQIQRRATRPDAPVAPVRADRRHPRQRDHRLHGRGEYDLT